MQTAHLFSAFPRPAKARCASRTAYRPCADCKDVHACAVRALMLEVRDVSARVLDNTSLDEMCRRARQVEAISYDI